MLRFVICVIITRFLHSHLTPLHGPIFRHGGHNFDTHALFCEKEADYCKHVILTVICHLLITREATFPAPINKFDLSVIGHEVKLC